MGKKCLNITQVHELCSDAKIYQNGLDRRNIELIFIEVSKKTEVLTFKEFPNFLNILAY